MTKPEEGAVQTIERTFTPADVRAFAELSGDDQPRHTEADDDGRLMVQGLLTATLPTSIGGDNEVLAHRMDFRFVRPVYTGDAVTCRMRTESVDERGDRYDFLSSVECTVDGETVLEGSVEGLVRKD